jgi:flagellar biosynthetic protein FliR
MFPNFHLNEANLLIFALILIRVSSFLFTWPVFSVFSVPRPAKILLAVVLTICLFPVIPHSELSTEILSLNIIWFVMKELFVGLCLGFFTRLLFFAVSVAGQMISTSMGLSSGQMFNPALGNQSTATEQFFTTLATLIFLGINGHHYFLTGLAQSFDVIQISSSGASFAFFKNIGDVLQMVCVAGIKISAPVMIAVFFLNIALGIIGRVVPQINVLVTSLPINIMSGFLIIFMMIPLYLTEVDSMLNQMTEVMFKVMKSL